MKRMLSSFKHLTLAAVLLAGMSAPIIAQSIEGCNDWLIIYRSDGRRTFCSIASADDDWCYYDCLTA